MAEPLPPTLLDAASRGTLVALSMLLASVLRRDRPRLAGPRVPARPWPSALACRSSVPPPLFEALVPRGRQGRSGGSRWTD